MWEPIYYTSLCEKMKKFFSLVLIFITALVLVACKKAKLTIADADKNISVVIGDTVTVTPELTEGFTLKWTSSDQQVVSITAAKDTLSAVLTAVGEGTATVTVAVDGKDVTGTITVTVAKPDPTAVNVTGAGSVAIGATLTLTGTVVPELASQTLTWTSSDTAKATVANGVVTGVAEGEVTIKATSVQASVYKEVTVTVVKPDPETITVTGPDTVIMAATGTFTATVNPDLAPQGVTWTTSSPAIATVDSNGVVTGVAPGTVTVRATSSTKMTVVGTKEITVVRPDPTSVAIDGPEIVPLEEKRTFSATVTPAIAEQDVVWSVDDATKATIDPATGELTAKALGTVKVKATTVKLSTVFVEFTVTIEPPRIAVDFDLDQGYWPITGTDAFIDAEPISSLTTQMTHNTTSAGYWTSDDPEKVPKSPHFFNVYLHRGSYETVKPSVWQNRIFLNRNDAGFFEVEAVREAGSANTNPTLTDYEFALYAHSGYPAAYDFLGDIEVGDVITLNGFEIDKVEDHEIILDVTINVYKGEDAVSTGTILAPHDAEVILPNPARLGALFGGWYDNAEFTGEPVIEAEASIKVYAKWTYNLSYIVVGDYEEGETFYNEDLDRYFVYGITAFDNLADALDAVAEDGTVFLEEGEYDAVATVSKNGITITGEEGAVIKNKINVAADVEGLTIEGLEFTDKAAIAMAADGGVKGFTFKNNVVSDLTISTNTFIGFSSNGTKDNEDFVIEDNEFLIGESVEAARWIRGGNIKNLTINNNIFEGIPGIYVDAVCIEGNADGNAAGIGVGGVVEINDNLFDKIGQRALWFRRISATEFNFTGNVLDQTGGTTAGGGLQIEVLAPETVLEVNIKENIFKNITHYFGIRLGTAATPTLGDVDIRFNQFINFTLATAYYVQGYEGATKLIANQNYFDVAPTADDMPNVTSYTPAYDDLDDLEEAIALSKPQTVTFDSQGGTEVASVEVPGGYTVEEPEAPTRVGYDFVGWYKEAAGTNAFAFDEDKITEATTLYAKWKAIEYDITYHYDGGAVEFANQTELFEAFLDDFYAFLELDPAVVSVSDFKHGEGKTSGYDGLWIKDGGDYRGLIYPAGPRPSAPNAEGTTFIEDARYFAKYMPFFDMMEDFIQVVNATQHFWEETLFVGPIRLRQFVMGAKPAAYVTDAQMAMMPVYTLANPTYTIVSGSTLPTPLKDNFVFGGWFLEEDLSGKPLASIPTGRTGDIDLYAKWLDEDLDEDTIIVDAALAAKEILGQRYVFDGKVYQVGENYFSSLTAAAEKFADDLLVVVRPGVYKGDFVIDVDRLILLGANEDTDPNVDTRGAESVIDGVITIKAETNDLVINGFKFVGESQILNIAGPAGTAEAVKTNINGFEFSYNVVESELEDGRFLYFVEGASSYSRDLAFINNYFTVVAEDSELAAMVNVDNNAGLYVVDNVFENIPGDAFLVSDKTKGLAGNAVVFGNAFVNIGGSGFKATWISPIPGTQMNVHVVGNTFNGIGDVAVYFGSMNNADTIESLLIRNNDFKDVDGGVHLNRVVKTADIRVIFNKFLDEPETFYVRDAKTAAEGYGKTLDASKNAFLVDGKVVTPVAAKLVGAPDVTDQLTGSARFNAYGQLEISFNEFETNSDYLREVFIADWNEMFETTWTTLNATAFHNSASTGAGGNATKDISDSNLYKFFHSEAYGDKWGWLLDYLATQGGVHPQRQLVALMGDGTSPDGEGGTWQLWNLMHLTYSFANFFNQATDTSGYAPIDFNVLTKYATVKDFNDAIYKNLELYDMVYVGQEVEFPEAPEKTNYLFVKYILGEDDYAPGDDYTITVDAIVSLVYEAIKYDVKFFDGEDELTTLAVKYTHEAALTLPVPTKLGYVFLGWYDNADLEGTAVTAIAKGSTGDKTFYAEWEKIPFVEVDVTFEFNGGKTGTYIEATRYSASGDNTGAPITIGSGRGGLYWEVMGFKETASAGVYELVGKGGGYQSDDATLYISYHDGCTSPYKAALIAIYNSIKVGDFVYVPKLPSAAAAVTSVDMMFLDLESTVTSEEKTMLLPEELYVLMARPGYRFLGWYDNPELTGEAIVEYPGFEDDDNVTDVTYYAKWALVVSGTPALFDVEVGETYSGEGTVFFNDVAGTILYIVTPEGLVIVNYYQLDADDYDFEVNDWVSFSGVVVKATGGTHGQSKSLAKVGDDAPQVTKLSDFTDELYYDVIDFDLASLATLDYNYLGSFVRVTFTLETNGATLEGTQYSYFEDYATSGATRAGLYKVDGTAFEIGEEYTVTCIFVGANNADPTKAIFRFTHILSVE